jgi:hypothetical protein
MDERLLLREWKEARAAYDGLLERLLGEAGDGSFHRPDEPVVQEAIRRREFEELARDRYESARAGRHASQT